MITYKDYGAPLLITPYLPAKEGDTIQYFINRFIDIPTLKTIGDENTWWILIASYRVVLTGDFGSISINFGAGFCTDWASVPKAFRSFVDNDDRLLMLPSLMHDALFKTKFFGKNKIGYDTANEIFDSLMEYFGVKSSTRDAVMSSVSSWIGYNIYKKEQDRDSEKYLHCQIERII